MYTAVEHIDKKVVGLSGSVTLFLKDFTTLKFKIQGQEDALNVAASIEALSSIGKQKIVYGWVVVNGIRIQIWPGFNLPLLSKYVDLRQNQQKS